MNHRLNTVGNKFTALHMITRPASGLEIPRLYSRRAWELEPERHANDY
jgi:hypothetical protein